MMLSGTALFIYFIHLLTLLVACKCMAMAAQHDQVVADPFAAQILISFSHFTFLPSPLPFIKEGRIKSLNLLDMCVHL